MNDGDSIYKLLVMDNALVFVNMRLRQHCGRILA